MPTHPLCIPERRRWLQAGAGWLALAALAGCKEETPPLRLGSIAFAGYEPIFLAREQGWLDERRVRLLELHSNTDTLRALAAGRLEAAQTTLDEFLTARAGGIDLRVIAVLDISVGADMVIARPGLREPKRVAGRRVAAEESAVGAVMLAAFLRAHELTPTDIVKVTTTLADSPATMRNAEADYIVSAEPWASQMLAQGGTNVFDSRRIPERIVDVMVARADAFAAHQTALSAVVAAHFRALAFIQAQPERASAMMAPRLQLPPDQVPSAFKGLRQPAASESRALLAPDGHLLRQVKTLEGLMLEDGLIGARSDNSTYFETRFHPQS